eukprot:scaffold8469_cov112-Isochrysis_galbana.AAC.6
MRKGVRVARDAKYRVAVIEPALDLLPGPLGLFVAQRSADRPKDRAAEFARLVAVLALLTLGRLVAAALRERLGALRGRHGRELAQVSGVSAPHAAAVSIDASEIEGCSRPPIGCSTASVNLTPRSRYWLPLSTRRTRWSLPMSSRSTGTDARVVRNSRLKPRACRMRTS